MAQDWTNSYQPYTDAAGNTFGQYVDPRNPTAQNILDPGHLLSSAQNPGTQYANQQQIQNQINQGYASSNQAAPQIGPMDAQQQAQFRQMQLQQAQQLQGIASGQQQGAGELAIQRQVANANAQQMAMARSNRGASAGMGNIGAARNMAGIGLSGAGQGQQAAMQDQMNAQGMLTGALSSGRGQDIGLRGQDIGIAQGNQQAQLGQYGMNTQRGLGYLGQQTGMDQAQMQAGMQQYQQANQRNDAIKGGLFNAVGGLLGASDERLKTDVKDAGSDIDEMLDRLQAKSYRYKDEKTYGEGPRAGIMAQDLARSKAGKAIVADLPGGEGMKGFDVTKAVSAALASMARLNQRMRKAGI